MTPRWLIPLWLVLWAAPVLAADDPAGAGDEAPESSEDASEDTSAADEVPAPPADPVPGAEPVLDDRLSRYRTPFSVLAEQSIGTASKSVEFNWRRTTAHLAATGSHYFELNNFNTLRAGGLVRLPVERFIIEVGGSYVWVWDTPSTELLALTPYRQPARPRRIEVDLAVGFPVAEGVITTFPRLFPAVEIVFSPYVGLRYLVYPMSFENMKVREIVGALASPTLSGQELNNLDDRRLDAMSIDPGRYGVMIGFGNEIYFKQGVFIMPRAMFAVPVFAPVSETDLLFWADLSLAIGVAF